jgi:hypothetical protein
VEVTRKRTKKPKLTKAQAEEAQLQAGKKLRSLRDAVEYELRESPFLRQWWMPGHDERRVVYRNLPCVEKPYIDLVTPYGGVIRINVVTPGDGYVAWVSVILEPEGTVVRVHWPSMPTTVLQAERRAAVHQTTAQVALRIGAALNVALE